MYLERICQSPWVGKPTGDWIFARLCEIQAYFDLFCATSLEEKEKTESKKVASEQEMPYSNFHKNILRRAGQWAA